MKIACSLTSNATIESNFISKKMLKYSYDTRPDMIYLVEIPAEYIEESHLPYEIVLSLLEDDDVDLSCIQSIRILNK